MARPKNLGIFILAIYLIVTSLMVIFKISLGELHLLVPIMGLVAGICLLLGR